MVTIGNFTFFIASIKEPFKKEFFTTRGIDIYMTLCRVFGEDEQKFIPIKFMYMMIQISSFGVDIIFHFASYLEEEIRVGLVGIAKRKIENIFGNY